MFRFRVHYRRVDEELEAHIADLEQESLARGVMPDIAHAEAMQRFGDIATVQRALATKNLDSFVVIGIVYVLSALVLSVSLFAVSEPVTQARLEWATFMWVCVSVIAALFVLTRWVIEYYGLDNRRVIWTSGLLTLLLSMVITLILDIDNFEVVIHAIGLGGLLVVLSYAFWKRMSVRAKQIILYGYAAAVTYSTIIEEPLFSFIGTARCLFLTPDRTPLIGGIVNCQQVSWLNGALFPAYVFLILGVPFLWSFLFRYVRNAGTPAYRKWCFAGAMVMLPFAPLFVHDVNNYGELDILPWKPGIYEAYDDVLGRAPEQKDIDFYAMTRSYERMEQVRSVLYASYERRLKIDLLYQEELGRHATEEEIEVYVQNRASVEQIRAELSASVGVPDFNNDKD